MNPAFADLAAEAFTVATVTGLGTLAAFVLVFLALAGAAAVCQAETPPNPTPCQHADNVARVEAWRPM